jgi:hypothetical protein
MAERRGRHARYTVGAAVRGLEAAATFTAGARVRGSADAWLPPQRRRGDSLRAHVHLF